MSGQGSFVPTDDFYPRPPRGGRRGMADTEIHWAIFLSTPSARRATWSFRFLCRFFAHFYPRPPRGGRPSAQEDKKTWSAYFYPRPPRGGRPRFTRQEEPRDRFLSTPSARRATTAKKRETGWSEFLSTPSARRATAAHTAAGTASQFLSTPSARRATRVRPPASHCAYISIHALREEGDGAARAAERSRQYFYPRPPRGGRLTS